MESCQPVWLNQVPTASSKICTSRLYVFICHRGSLPHSSPIQSPSLPLPTPPSGPSFPPSPSTHYGNGREGSHAPASIYIKLEVNGPSGPDFNWRPFGPV